MDAMIWSNDKIKRRQDTGFNGSQSQSRSHWPGIQKWENVLTHSHIHCNAITQFTVALAQRQHLGSSVTFTDKMLQVSGSFKIQHLLSTGLYSVLLETNKKPQILIKERITVGCHCEIYDNKKAIS